MIRTAAVVLFAVATVNLPGTAGTGPPRPRSLASASTAAPRLPSTLAGTTLRGFLEAFNGGDVGELTAFLESRFKPAVLESPRFGEYLREFGELRAETSGVDVEWVLPSIERHVAATVKARSDRRLYHIDLYLDRTPPRKLKEIKFREPKLAIGAPAPPLGDRVVWLAGEPVRDFEQGTIYVLDFWATWCSPCIEQIPRLSRLAADFRDRGVVVVGVATLPYEGAVPVEEYVASSEAIRYRIAEENGSDYLRRYTDTSVPTVAIVDGDGRLAWIWPGTDAPVEEVVERMVEGRYRLPPRG